MVARPGTSARKRPRSFLQPPADKITVGHCERGAVAALECDAG